MADKTSITKVEFRNFKALENYSISLDKMNILVGPNNSGKSTILNAFRVLAAGLRRANSYNADYVNGPYSRAYGYNVLTDDLPISMENVHTNYDSRAETTVTFHLSNKHSLTLYFPPNRGCVLIPSGINRSNKRPSDFRKLFPLKVGFVPVLGPLEHEEELVQERTVQRNLVTHRASRHFRNYWYYFPEKFDEFADLINQTWSGMEILRPEKIDYQYLVMFCKENRFDRELYWAGFGFQIWCQLLTHIIRNSDMDLLIVDEPDIYLHPDMQRQILALLREAGPDILLATHSTEIISEASPSDIILINKTRRSATRLKNVDQIQNALEVLGSSQNITLTQLARTRRVLFVEGNDFQILSKFARQLGLSDIANQTDITVVSSGGFSNWERIKSLAWGFEKTLGKSIIMGAVFDRDYRSDEEIENIQAELNKNVHFAHIHYRKELENYLLVPTVLDRAIQKKMADAKKRGKDVESRLLSTEHILQEITEAIRADILSQYTSWRSQYFRSVRSSNNEATITKETLLRFEQKWSDLNTRMEIIPGKEVMSGLNKFLNENYGINLTPNMIISEFKRDEIPLDLLYFLKRLNKFKQLQVE